MRTFMTVFGVLFLAELGDKTQLAVVAFSSEGRSPWAVFLGASLALATSTALALLVGRVALRVVPTAWVRLGAGLLFLVVAVVVLVEAVPEVLRG